MLLKPGDLIKIGFAVLIFAQKSTADDLPAGWFQEGANYYGVYYEAKNWTDSENVCQSFGGHLASFHSYTTLSAILRRVSGRYKVWIGLNDADHDGNYTWTDNSAVDYTRWDFQEPNNNNGDEYCVNAYLFRTGRSYPYHGMYLWNDENCNQSREYVCMTTGFPVPVTVPPPKVFDRCEETDWFSFEDSCYNFGPELVKWKEAGQYCSTKHAHLVSILSLAESIFIADVFKTLENPPNRFWMGMRKTKWSDGSLMEFNQWSTNEPNIRLGDDGCGMIDPDEVKWYNKDCEFRYGYICKKHNASIPSSSISANETKTSSGACPENFFSVGHTNKCFYLGGTGSQKLNWIQSRQTCASIEWSQNVTLARIGSQLDQDVATMLLSTLKDDEDVWIGLYADQGRYYWNNSEAVTIAPWAVGQPNDSGTLTDTDNCVSIIGNSTQGTDFGYWKVDLCSKSNAYLCQTTKDDSKTPTGSLTSLPGSSPPITCPDGYNWFKSACFSVKTDAATWEDARATCQNEGGDLASMLDASEVANIKFIMYLNDVTLHSWIGLRYQADSFRYVWTDGSPMTTDFWQDGQPNMYHETDKCVAFKGSWDDRPCTEKKPFVCQQRPVPKAKASPSVGVGCVNSSAYGDFCYVARPGDTKTWSEAVEACQGMGMQLVSLHSVEETAFVQNLVNGQAGASWNVWTGLVNGVGGFQWVDRSPFDFEHWSAKNPSFTWKDEDVECVEMIHYGFWSDLPCGVGHGYVCKAPQARVTSSGGNPAGSGLSAGTISIIVIAVILVCALAVSGFIVYRKRLPLQDLSFDNFGFNVFKKERAESA